MDRDAVLPAIISVAGGEIVGRVRLQKMIFLLKLCGAQTNYVFRYHHYGPYSRDVDNAIDKAKGQGVIEEQVRNRAGDGAEYSVFSFPVGNTAPDESLIDNYRSIIQDMVRRSSIVLELSATIIWLAQIERVADWKEELRVRKGNKVTEEREKQAIQILERYGLQL